MNLIIFTLEQEESKFTDYERSLCEAIIDTFTDAFVEIDSQS